MYKKIAFFVIMQIVETLIKSNVNKIHKKRQSKAKGVGPVYHRKYSVEIKNPKVSPLKVMKQFQKDINSFCPHIMVRFEKIKGSKSVLKVNDEFVARLTGPWNSPTRVTKVTTKGFHMATLEGSMEAGEIQFYLSHKSGKWIFTVESLARSKDKLIDGLYDKIPVLKVGQAAMWTYVCNEFNKKCEALPSKVKIVTKKENKISRF